jgi:hypothetical protein
MNRLLCVAPAVLAFGTASAQLSTSTGTVAAFRDGLEISVDGNSWGQSRTVALSPSRCPPSSTSPCAAGTPPLVVSVRFPALPDVVDGGKVLAQLGESGSKEARYYIRPVPANAGSPVCGGVLSVSSPQPAMRMAINLAAPGTPLPVTCRWSVLTGVPNPKAAHGFDLIWSDTATVHVISK